jgi:hypothetical protein
VSTLATSHKFANIKGKLQSRSYLEKGLEPLPAFKSCLKATNKEQYDSSIQCCLSCQGNHDLSAENKKQKKKKIILPI